MIGMIAVHRVAAAGEVFVRAVFVQHVINFVLQALEAERGARFVAFGRVVEDDVENDFDAGGVQLADHFLELPHLVARLVAGHVAAVGREEGHGVVAPVIGADGFGAVGLFDGELVDGHQLDRGDAERFQVRNFFDDAGVRAGLIDVARRAAREAADVRFVDDRFGERPAEMAVALPIEGVVDDDALRRTDDAVFRRLKLAGERAGVRIDQPSLRVEALALGRVERAVGLVMVKLAGLEAGNEYAPNIAPTVGRRIELDQLYRLAVV